MDNAASLEIEFLKERKERKKESNIILNKNVQHVGIVGWYQGYLEKSPSTNSCLKSMAQLP